MIRPCGSVGFFGDLAAVQHQTPAPLKLPSDGGKLEEWWVRSQSNMANADLQSRICAGGYAGDASWRGACAEYVRGSSIACTEHCRHLRGGSDFFGDAADETFDICAARDERTCFNVCLDDKLFDSHDLVLDKGNRSNPDCVYGLNHTEGTSVQEERQEFWVNVLTHTGNTPGDFAWTEKWEWEGQKKANKRLQKQFDSFWDIVCTNDKAAACKFISPAAKKKSFLFRKSSSCSKTSRHLRKYLATKKSLQAYKSWLETSQFPGTLALSAGCQQHAVGNGMKHMNAKPFHLLQRRIVPVATQTRLTLEEKGRGKSNSEPASFNFVLASCLLLDSVLTLFHTAL